MLSRFAVALTASLVVTAVIMSGAARGAVRAVTNSRRTAGPSLLEAQYGGELFETASRYARAVASSSGRARLRNTVRPPGLAASARLVAKLERITVSPTDSPSGRAIRAYLEERKYGIPKHRIAQGILIVPGSSQLYLRGHHRQAVRTNLHRARDAGLTCAHLARFAERETVVNQFTSGFTDSRERKLLIGRPESEWWAVFVASQVAGCSTPRSSARWPNAASRASSSRPRRHRCCSPACSTSSDCSAIRSRI